MCSILGYCGKDADYDSFKEALAKTASRGPDASRIVNAGNGMLGFNRLSIMGPAPSGMQPFAYGKKKTLNGSGAEDKAEIYSVCNGEIYGFRKLKSCLEKKGYTDYVIYEKLNKVGGKCWSPKIKVSHNGVEEEKTRLLRRGVSSDRGGPLRADPARRPL